MDNEDEFLEECLDEILLKSSTAPNLNRLIAADKPILGRFIETAASRHRESLDDVLKTLFDRLVPTTADDAAADEEEEVADKRLFVFRRGLELIQREGLLTSRSAGDLASLLTFQLNNLPNEALFDLIDEFLKKIKENDISAEESVELFPKILSCLAAKHDLTTEAGKAESGDGFKSLTIKRVLEAKWHERSVVRVVALCKDMDLKESEEKELVKRVLARLNGMDAKDLPPVVYQLLLLSGKHGLQRFVLQGLADFFESKTVIEEYSDEEDEESDQIEISRGSQRSGRRNSSKRKETNDLQRAQGTVLMHVATAMRHSRELSQEIVKYLKALSASSPKKVLRPFNVALAMSLAKIPFYEESVGKLMKDCVSTCFRDAILTSGSDWLRELLLRDPEGSDAGGVSTIADETVRLLKRVVLAATSGWEHILEQLVKFSLSLMEMAASAAIGAFGGSSSADWEHAPLIPASLSENAAKMKPERLCGVAGSKTLLLLFDRHEEAREEIVEQLLNRLVVFAHNPVAGFVYAEALAKAAHSAPFSLIESSSNRRRVREMIEQLPSFAPALSKCVLSALMPVFKLSPAIRDDLLLTLRKCLYNRKSDSRKAAVHGYLLLLRNFVCEGSSDLSASQLSQTYQFSQAVAPVNPRFAGGSSSSSSGDAIDGNMALCLELLQSLRRTFSHQADVRDLVLEGLPAIVKRNDRLREAVLDLLVGRLSTYVNQRGLDDEFGGPPVALDKCVRVTNTEAVVVSEPLGNLIRCCVAVLRLSKKDKTRDGGSNGGFHDDDDDNVASSSSSSSLKELTQTLRKLSIRLSKCDMDDFDIDKKTEVTASTTKGIENLLRLTILLGVVEALIEFKTFETTPDDIEVMVALIRFYTKVQTFIKDALKATTSGGANKKKTDDDSQAGSDADSATTTIGSGGSDAGGSGGGGSSGGSVKNNNSSMLTKTNSTLSLGCVASLLLEVCGSSTKEEPSEDNNNVARLLRAKHPLLRHLFGAAHQKIAQLAATGFCEGASNLTVDQLFRHVSHVGVAAWAQLVHPITLSEDAHSQMQTQEKKNVKRGAQPFKSLLIDTLSSVVALANEKFSKTHFRDLMADLRSELDGNGNNNSVDDCCFDICKELQTQWDKSIRRKDDSNKKWAEVGAYLTLVGQFHAAMTPESPKSEKILGWLDDIATGEVIEDIVVVKRLFTMIFAFKSKRYSKMYRVASDARIHFGDLEEESVNEESHELDFQSINPKSAAVVIIVALEKLSKMLDDVQFVIGKLKAVVVQESQQQPRDASRPRTGSEDSSANDDDVNDETDVVEEQMRKSREKIITTLHHAQKILGQLCFCKLPFGSAVVKELLNQTRKFYTVAASFVNDVYLTAFSKKSCVVAPEIDSAFRPFLKKLEEKLQLNIHPFIQHLENEKMSSAEAKKSKSQKQLLMRTAVRDSLQLPKVVFAMETFNNAVLSIVKAAKLKDVTFSTKNVARDFRIAAETVREAIEEEEEEEPPPAAAGRGKENAGGKRKAGGGKTAKVMVKKRKLDEDVEAEGGMVTSTQREGSQGRKISIGASGNVSVIDTQ